MSDILEGLTEAQREAVTHIKGPLLVVAGPGSGKTRVITRRIAHLLYCGIRPYNILAITFTNKAANEMRERVDRLVTEKGVWISTFHSFCARHLRRYADRLGYRRDFTVYDAADSMGALKRIAREMELAPEDWKPAALEAVISDAKGRLREPEDLEREAEETGDFRLGIAAAVYGAYQELLRRANAMDFDDLLMQMARLVEKEPAALAQLRRRHQFVLIDEFQDTNHTQYAIVKGLADKHRNICATGDPDQSIYSWRGGRIENILDFEQDFPEARVVFLDRNYRSTQSILAAADAVVANNVNRKPRSLYTENPPGEKIRLVNCADGREEAGEIAAAISAEMAAGTTPSDVAVFYRVNWLSRQIEEALIEEGVSYQIVGGVEFYNRKEVKDILSYLRVAANPADETSLRRVINVPGRRIGEKTVARLAAWAGEKGLGLMDAVESAEARGAVGAQARAGLESFVEIVARIRGTAGRGARAAVEKAIAESGYPEMLGKSGDERDKERMDNLQELVNAAAQFDKSADGDGLEGFLEQAALVSDIDTWHDKDQKVTLMTMHAAKGLEFPVVFVAGLEESILPHERSAESADQIEEERRIFFVAMTRAEKKLCLSRADGRLFYGSYRSNMPSRFLREIPRELLAISEGGGGGFRIAAPTPGGGRIGKTAAGTTGRVAAGSDAGQPKAAKPSPHTVGAGVSVGARVVHAVFGMGVVKAVSASGQWHKATVQFELAGTKKLILEKAGLQVIRVSK